MAQVTSDKDRAGIHSIDHFALEVPALKDAEACRDPDGNLVQVRVGPKTSPDAKMPPVDLHGGPGARDQYRLTNTTPPA